MSDNRILDVKFNNFKSRDEILHRLFYELELAKSNNVSKSIFHLNVYSINLAYINKEYKDALNNADIVYIDSVGLKLSSNFLNHSHISDPYPVPTWVHDFFTMLPDGSRLFFVGDEPEVIEGYAKQVTGLFPKLNVVGYNHGFFLHDPELEKDLLDRLLKTKPDVVLVGMGMPRQELWIQKITGVVKGSIFITVGAYYRRMLGIEKRPNPFITKIGMEWAQRFLKNPFRLFKRYIVGNPLFIYRMIKEKIKGRVD